MGERAPMKKLLTAIGPHAFLIACTLLSLGCQTGVSSHERPRSQSRLIDLTHAFGPDTIVWPTEQEFRLIPQHAEEMPGGYFYASNRLEMPEHGGTHIDAPIHFAKGGYSAQNGLAKTCRWFGETDGIPITRHTSRVGCAVAFPNPLRDLPAPVRLCRQNGRSDPAANRWAGSRIVYSGASRRPTMAVCSCRQHEGLPFTTR